MPFRSEKQRRYLWMHEPKVAKDWSKKYGSEPKSNKEAIKRRLTKRKGK